MIQANGNLLFRWLLVRPACSSQCSDRCTHARFEQYKQLSPPTVAQYGGRFLARGGRTETVEGEWSPRRLVILEFPSLERAQAWIDSVEYAPARRLRQLSARSNIILVEGVAPVG